VDSVCIGTNHLSHFILAMERGAQENSEILPFLHPSFLRATEQIIRAATKRGVTVSVCGEAAGVPAVACLLVGMGAGISARVPFYRCMSVTRSVS